MLVEPYVFFAGNCAQAMQHYQAILGGELHIMRYADAPADHACAQMPAGTGDLVMHAILKHPDGAFMASDIPPGQPHKGIEGIAVTLTFPVLDEARRVFDTLAKDGTVQMPFSPTFWSEGFGMLVDRFGVPWLINGPLLAPEST